MARVEFVSRIEFVAQVSDEKDCLMAQDEQANPGSLWFNIDVPKGHGFSSGDQVRITIERV